MVPAFDAEHQDYTINMGMPRGKKRAADDPPDSEPAADHHRHRAYLERAGANKKKELSWRPKQLHRVAAKKWLDAVDEQIRQMTDLPGLAAAKPDWESEQWRDANWRNWVHFQFAMDCGSDGVAATNACEHLWGLNIERIHDTAHACNCDHKQILRQMKLYNFYLCMAISWNLVFGPDRNHERRHQLHSCMRALYEKSVPESTPLFLAKVNMIIDCLRRNGYEFTGERPHYVQAWEILAKRPFAVAEGERCTMSRFCSTITANERRAAWWEVEAFERAFLALETGVLKGSAAAKLKVCLGLVETVGEAAA